MTTAARSCSNNTPPWFSAHWRDWHRGHGCDKDDGKPRSEAALAQIVRREASASSAHVAMSSPYTCASPEDTLLAHALSERATRRLLLSDEDRAAPEDTLLARALSERATRRPLLSDEDREALTRLRTQLAWRTLDVEAARDAYVPVLDRLLGQGAPR